ncbi:MAG: DUF3604 domain-containing protein [Bryobacteraceae bacterium]
MKKVATPGTLLLLMAAGAVTLRPAPPQPPAQPEPVTILMTFGLNAKADQKWDGSIEVAGGGLVGLRGHQFSEEDSVDGSAWKLRNRRDEIVGFARINYTEMSPAHLPPVLFFPVGLYAAIRPGPATRVSVRTAQGDFTFNLSEIGAEPKAFLNGAATVIWAPTVANITTERYEDDEPEIARLGDGSIAVAWVGYREREDRVFFRKQENGAWSPTEAVTTAGADIFRCSISTDENGDPWVVWSQRDGAQWHLWGRHRRAGRWQSPIKLTDAGSNIFHRSASNGGEIFLVWQSFRGPAGKGQSDIYLRRLVKGQWVPEQRVSESPANDWEPSVAAGSDGAAFIAWDSYDKSNYDIFFRSFEGGKLGAIQPVTSNARFQAHTSIAVDSANRPWLAWDESGANWGKDQGFLINPPISTPLHQERTIRLARWDGRQWLEPKAQLAPFYVYQLFPNFENPRIAFDSKGTLTMVFRHWTRKEARSIGSKIGWENYLTRFDGANWTHPVPLDHSRGSIEKRPALARGADGGIWAAWMTDERPFTDLVPRNAEIYVANLKAAPAAPSYDAAKFVPLADPYAEELPIHIAEKEDVAKIRDYTIRAGNRSYKIYRGDMHRHSDVSQDFKYDGSLIEIYRYALDAAAFDYIVPTDHQLGYDQEFTWWQDEKLTDLFHVAGTFTPLFGYERSLNYPNGHRNVILPKRGTRPLPIPPEEARGQTGAAKLYEYLRSNNGISMPHSSGTDQGTDWRDNDPDVEPLIEIYQGYRASYEYENAPAAASREKLITQRSGYQAAGYWWKALEKGYKLGVQASSDHWSTHISYACILAENFTREGMFDALKKRHAYGATDNIVLDFQARSGEATYIMGDSFKSRTAPALTIRARGTSRISQIAIVKNQQFVYVGRPNSRDVDIEFADRDFQPGFNYYYTRVMQEDGRLAWSSPIWVE